jgi:DnaJ-class molecular chaperone
MDDYYELLDVAADADRDDIRGAYRAKRDALQAQDGADNRAKIAELNRAWNVLSDPAQRDRYDERLAVSRDADDVDDDDEYDDDDGDGGDRPVPVTRAQRREETRRARGGNEARPPPPPPARSCRRSRCRRASRWRRRVSA